MLVKEMLEGSLVEEFLRVTDIQNKVKKDGNAYKMVTVGDTTGTLVWNVWDNIELFDEQKISVGDIVYINGTIKSWNNIKQLQNTVYRKATAEDIYDTTKFFISVPQDVIQNYTAKLNVLIASLSTPWNEVVGAIYNDPQIKDKFFKSPASISFHNNFLGGLLLHTVEVATGCDMRTNLYPSLNRDLLISMALLHDIGKVFEYDVDKFVHTDEGMLKRHIFLGASYVDHFIGQGKFNLTKSQKDLLVSGILSSHNTKEFGSPVEPLTIEAFVLAMEDNFETYITYWSDLKRNTSEGTNFEYSSAFNRKVFIGKYE